ncbi:unnamed protein product [Calicophoron daubneyi]|uniref:TLDc domain-containing protein n=1 Tax=Calicophoron daubneyi TaxID=300641 RepID=A0AAV2TG30_CALDB
MSATVKSSWSGFVDTTANRASTVSAEQANDCERAIREAVRRGGKVLKRTIRHLNISASHPARTYLWPLLISSRFSVKITDDASGDRRSSQAECKFSDDRSEMVGYEISDQSLLPVYLLNNKGRMCLREVMHQIVVRHPEIVYAPQLWPLVALLLHYHSADVSRECIQVLLQQSHMLVQTKTDWKEHCLALERIGFSGLISRSSRRRWKSKPGSLSPSPTKLHPNTQYNASLCLAQWAYAVWQFPLEITVRIIDCYLVEGPKILYRAGLVLWKYVAKSLTGSGPKTTSKLESEGDFVATARALNVDPAVFLKQMFRIRNFGRGRIDDTITVIRQNKGSSQEEADLDRLLMHPCGGTGKSTIAAYLLSDDVTPSAFVHPSECIGAGELATIITSIGDKRIAQLCKPILLFSTNRDGTSLQTLYAKAALPEIPSTLLVVRSSSGRCVVGAFCSDRWQARAHPEYFGRGTCFLFRVKPAPVVIFPWVGVTGSPSIQSTSDQSFQYASADSLQIGRAGQSGQPGLGVDARLSIGMSGPSPTFANQCLISDTTDMVQKFGAAQDSCTFSVGLVELIGFEDL